MTHVIIAVPECSVRFRGAGTAPGCEGGCGFADAIQLQAAKAIARSSPTSNMHRSVASRSRHYNSKDHILHQFACCAHRAGNVRSHRRGRAILAYGLQRNVQVTARIRQPMRCILMVLLRCAPEERRERGCTRKSHADS